MKKVKIFLGAACLTVALAAATVTTVNARYTSPEYYLDTDGICQDLPVVSQCVTGTADCFKDVSATQLNRPIFDDKNSSNECVNQLHQQ